MTTMEYNGANLIKLLQHLFIFMKQQACKEIPTVCQPWASQQSFTNLGMASGPHDCKTQVHPPPFSLVCVLCLHFIAFLWIYIQVLKWGSIRLITTHLCRIGK